MLKKSTKLQRGDWRNALILAILIALQGLACLTLPSIAQLEPDIGLKWLFDLRGSRTAPEDVVVVTIDRESSKSLQLPNVPRKWPRSLHAELVRILHAAGASVISFDMIFTDHRDPQQDKEFAQAMQEAGNVILFEYLQSESQRFNGSTASTSIHIEQRLLPIPEFAQSAVAVAPFNLPKIPERVNQAWLFKSSAGDLPTLPVVALHQHLAAHFQQLKDQIHAVSGERDLPDWLRQNHPPETPGDFTLRLHQFFQENDLYKQQLADSQEYKNTVLGILLSTHLQGDGSGIYLDFYGPARSITTVPYYQVLAKTSALDFKNKAVFVGFSARLQPQQKDGFYTVFTDENGLDVSGVEIMATTFANLLERKNINPLTPPYNVLLVTLFGFLAGLFLYRIKGAKAVIFTVLISGIYLGISYWLFASQSLWIPLVIPLMIQLPLALLFALLSHYLISHRERSRLHYAFKKYVPEHIANTAASMGFDSLEDKTTIFGACLATDAAEYTPFSEAQTPTDLHDHLNDYFEQLFIPVHQRGGLVVDVIGDAMLSAWVEGKNKDLRRAACEAALEIQQRLNQQTGFLSTRIGLHCGDVSVGNVGAGDHFQYRFVGDVVNTSTRIEGLNKQLGTEVLASAEMLEELDELNARKVGRFRLKGKDKAITLYEIKNQPFPQQHLEMFDAGLTQFQKQNWAAAINLFSQLLKDYPGDGPCLFYLPLTQQFQRKPPQKNWDGVVNITQK
jgi:adenylate cyclase